MKITHSRVTRALGSVLASLILIAALSAYAKAVPLTAAQWQDDIRFMMAALERQHPNAYRRNKKEVIEAAAKRLMDAVPSMGENEILVGMMRVVALVQDGHTNLFPATLRSAPVFPVRMYLFDDGLYVVSAPKQYADLVGGRVVEVGGISADEALKRAFDVVAADNDMGRRENAPLLIDIPQIANGLKLTSDPSRLKLTIDKGGKKTVEITAAGNIGDLIRTPADWVDAGRTAPAMPMYLRHPGDPYWFEYDRPTRTIYVQQNQVQNREGGETLAEFYKRVFDLVATGPVDKLVLDLRNNDGGNNALVVPAVIGLIQSKVDERGKLFVITGRRTFSAAQNFVNHLERWTNAIFVGEPTAGHPNHYGDNRPVELPNSKLRVNISTVYWQDVDPRDTRQWTAPEIAASLTWKDYSSGIDPAWDAIQAYSPGASLAALTGAVRQGKDVATFAGQLEKFVADPTHKYIDTEAAVNRLGYDLLNAKRTADAVEVFKLNAKMHPTSANVYDSLGDGYQAIGNKAEAIKAYEKALSIDPNYPSSRQSLEKLRQQ